MAAISGVIASHLAKVRTHTCEGKEGESEGGREGGRSDGESEGEREREEGRGE